MKSVLQEITDPKHFDAFVDTQMQISTFKPVYEGEMDTDYSESGSFNEFVASYAAAQMGSIIAKNSEKPIQEMPDLGSIQGVLARMGDRWQIDNDLLDKILMLEGRYRNRAGNFSNEKKASEYQKILKLLFEPYERAAIAPHKTIDLLYFNGLSNGKYDINLTNNPNGVTFQLDLKIPTETLTANEALFSDHENSDPVAVCKRIVNQMRTKGKIVEEIQMNFKTISDVLASKKIKNAFTMDIAKGKVASTIVSEVMLNEYFKVVGLPPIKVVDVFVTNGDGVVENAFVNDRVVFRTSSSVAKLMVKDALESKDPHPNKVYSTYKDNLIASYRREEGRFVEYEMNAIPVFNGRNEVTILKVDVKAP